MDLSGIYIFSHPYDDSLIKIGSSINIHRRITDSTYITMFPPDNPVKMIACFSIENHYSREDILYIEKSIHRYFDSHRKYHNRELFKPISVPNIETVLHNYGYKFHTIFNLNENWKQYITVEDNKLDNEEIEEDESYNNDIDDDIDNNIDNNKDNNNVKIDILTEIESHIDVSPLKHQINIIQKLLLYYNNKVIKCNNLAFNVINNIPIKGKLILPCGYGKSYISLFFLSEYYKNVEQLSVIIFVPSLLLAEQFEDLAITILTDNWNITSFHSEKEFNYVNNTKNLILATYQSSDILSQQLQNKADFVLYDEAHKTCITSKTLKEDSLFRNTLNLFPFSHKLFMTATEKIVILKDNKSENNEDDDELEYYSMDQENIYGKDIVKISFDVAITQDIICDYRLVIPLQDENPIDVIRSSFYELPIHHMLVYCNRIKDAKEYSSMLSSYGFNSYYLDGSHNKNQRAIILQSFENDPFSVLFSVKVLQEGISLPFVDSCYFIDSRTNQIDITQIIGRTLRKYKDKTFANIILPSQMLKYKPILNTLMEIDKRLTLNENDTGKELMNKVVGLSGNKIRNINNDVEVDQQKLRQVEGRIQFIIMSRNDGVWMYKYNLCLLYEQENPNKIIAKNTIYKIKNKEFYIHKWLYYQKQKYKNKIGLENGKDRIKDIGLTTDKELELLKKLRTWLIWEECINNGRNWHRNYNLCVQWEEENPDKIIKTNAIYNNIRIGNWLGKQLERYNILVGRNIKDKSRKPLTNDQLLELSKLRSWESKMRNINNTFDSKYALCLEYERLYPNSVISRKTKYKDVNLGNWIHYCRTTLNPNSKKPPPTTEQLNRLKVLRSWYTSPSDKWKIKYDLCIAYERYNPDKRITGKLIYNNYKIGVWFETNIKKYRGQDSCKLKDYQLTELEKLRSWNFRINNY